jgi:hypothetical protein
MFKDSGDSVFAISRVKDPQFFKRQGRSVLHAEGNSILQTTSIQKSSLRGARTRSSNRVGGTALPSVEGALDQ